MNVIYLTKEQADKVRGRHGLYSELQPIEIAKDTYILPLDVLDDPEHAEVLNELIKCQAVDITIEQIADEKSEDPTETVTKYIVNEIKSLSSVRPDLNIKQ